MKALVASIGLFLVSSSCGLEKRSLLGDNQHHQHHHGHERSARDSSVPRPAPGGYLPPTDDDYADYGSSSSSFGPSKGISTDGGVSDNPNAGSQDYEYEDEQNQNSSNANDVGGSSPNGRPQSGNRRNQQARNRNQKVKFGQRINQNTGNNGGRRNTNSRRNQQQGGRRNQNQVSRRNQQQGNQRNQLQTQINNLQGQAIDTLAQYEPQDGQIQQGDLNQIEAGQQSNTLQGGSRKKQQFGQQGGSPNQFGNINNQRNPGSGLQSANVANQRDTPQRNSYDHERPNQQVDAKSAADSYGVLPQLSGEENTNRGLPGQNRRNPDNSNFLPGQGNRGIQGQNRGYSDNNDRNQVQGQDAQSAPDSYGVPTQRSDEVNTNRGLSRQNIQNPENSNFLPGQGNRGIQGQNRGYSDNNDQNQVQGQDSQSAPDSYGFPPQRAGEVNTNRALPGQNIRNPDNSNFLPGQGNRGIQGPNRGYSDNNNSQFDQNQVQAQVAQSAADSYGVSPKGSDEVNTEGQGQNRQNPYNNKSSFDQNEVQAQSASDSYGVSPRKPGPANRGLPGQNIRNPDNSNFLPEQNNRGIQGQNRGYSDINNSQFGQNQGAPSDTYDVSPKGSGLSGQANVRGRSGNKQTQHQRRQHPSRFDGGVSPGQTVSPTINRFLPSSQGQNSQGQTNDNAGNKFPALGVQPGTNTDGFPFSTTGGSTFNYNDTLICPGGTLETCIQACPGTTAYIYGECVQECGERCQGGVKPTQLGQPGQTDSFGQPGQTSQFSPTSPTGQFSQPGQAGQSSQPGQIGQFSQTGPSGQFSQPGPTGQSSKPGQPGQFNQPGQSLGQAGQFDQQGQSPQFGQIGQEGVEGEEYQQSQYGQQNV